jgi:UDP-N-acetylmuramoyl-tripeptide--D-alanyl-D-alanine ligase
MMHLSEAAIATQGRVVGQDVLFNSVGTDSRSLSKNQLFIALKGEHFDGHAYAQQCLTQGAAAVMVSVTEPSLSPALLVKDTRLSLGDLATYWRQKFTMPLAAITGSNGKTTVKEMLANILHAHTGDAGSVLATQGNLNNDIGLPLTLLRLRQQHRYAVMEMGMNHAGEISYLTTIGRPTVALINNATLAHLAGLGSVEEIAKAKGEIFEGLAADGIAVINADDTFAPLWKKLATPHQIMTFGLDAAGLDIGADVSATYQLKTDGSDMQIHTLQGVAKTYLPVPGLHNVRNALAAATVALAMQIPLPTIAKGLAGFSGVKGRLQHKTGINGALVIDDTYNANPASTKAAIDVLAARPGEKLLVLGDMAELGADAAKMHAEIGSYSKAAGIKALYALGDLSRETVKAFGKGAQHYTTPEALAHDLAQSMKTGVTVLVKGSRFMQMERVTGLITTELIVTDKTKEMH